MFDYVMTVVRLDRRRDVRDRRRHPRPSLSTRCPLDRARRARHAGEPPRHEGSRARCSPSPRTASSSRSCDDRGRVRGLPRRLSVRRRRRRTSAQAATAAGASVLRSSEGLLAPAPPRSRASRRSPTGSTPSGAPVAERRQHAAVMGFDHGHHVPRDHRVSVLLHVRVNAARSPRHAPCSRRSRRRSSGVTLPFFLLQAFTALILILAANTSYQDFPRLSAILARDRFMPRQFINRGDRLVFSNGVLVLAIASSVLIYAFDAELTALIHLYVVGVFTSFTLSQTGMVRRWRTAEGTEGGVAASIDQRDRRRRPRGPDRDRDHHEVHRTAPGSSISAMPVIIALFLMIHRRYRGVEAELAPRSSRRRRGRQERSVLLVAETSDPATAEARSHTCERRPT